MYVASSESDVTTVAGNQSLRTASCPHLSCIDAEKLSFLMDIDYKSRVPVRGRDVTSTLGLDAFIVMHVNNLLINACACNVLRMLVMIGGRNYHYRCDKCYQCLPWVPMARRSTTLSSDHSFFAADVDECWAVPATNK